MIGYVTLGTNDMPRAAKFYDGLLSMSGAKRRMEFERSIIWRVSMAQPALAIMTPFEAKPATVGNGVMVSILVDTKDTVDALHQKARELGGKDEGAAGTRGPTFYCGYRRGLDDSKPNVFCIPQAS